MKPVCSNSCSFKYYLSLPQSERIALRNKLAVKQLSTTQKRVPAIPGTEAEVQGRKGKEEEEGVKLKEEGGYRWFFFCKYIYTKLTTTHKK